MNIETSSVERLVVQLHEFGTVMRELDTVRLRGPASMETQLWARLRKILRDMEGSHGDETVAG